MRSLALLAGLCLAVLCTSFGCDDTESPRAASAGQPAGTILLVTVDGVPAEQLAAFGGPVAVPALDRLVASGGRAGQGWTAVPMTRPAVASMMTGRGPDRHGVLDDVEGSLPAAVPVLAEALHKAGYKTAAFPGLGFLDRSSGLIRGFDAVDDPPPLPFGGGQRVPVPATAAQIIDGATAWLRSVPADQRAFLWVHFGWPGVVQLESPPSEDAIPRHRAVLAETDQALGRLLDAVAAAGRLEAAEILWTATYGDVTEAGSGLLGSGFSPAEAAVRVPFVHRPAPGRGDGSNAPFWSPDVAVTLAAAAGVQLDGAEGRDLASPGEADRTLLAWSAAPRDLMGWVPWVAARRGDVRFVLAGQRDEATRLDRTPVAADDPRVVPLRAAAGARVSLPETRVSLEAVTPVLKAHDVTVKAAPPEGRDLPFEARAQVLRATWQARAQTAMGVRGAALPPYKRAAEIDPLALSVLVEWSTNNSAQGPRPRGKKLIGEAAAAYPTSPAVLHWFGHVYYKDDRPGAERIWRAVLEVQPLNPDVLYDLACGRSLAGDVPGAVDLLRRALAAGYRNWDGVAADPDLRALREDPAFAALMREYGR